MAVHYRVIGGTLQPPLTWTKIGTKHTPRGTEALPEGLWTGVPLFRGEITPTMWRNAEDAIEDAAEESVCRLCGEAEDQSANHPRFCPGHEALWETLYEEATEAGHFDLANSRAFIARWLVVLPMCDYTDDTDD